MLEEDSVSQLFSLGHDFAEHIPCKAKQLMAKDELQFAYRSVMFFFFCKTYKSFQALRRLWDEGFPEDALPILRSMFEGMLQAKHIRQEPSRAQDFLDYDAYQRYKLYLKVKNSGDTELTRMIEQHSEHLKRLESEYARLGSAFRARKKWWGGSIEWLAQQHECERKYNTLYWIQSNFVHSGVGSLPEFIKDAHGGIRVNCYPAKSTDPFIPIEATLYLIGVTDWTQQALELELTDVARASLSTFDQIVRNFAS